MEEEETTTEEANPEPDLFLRILYKCLECGQIYEGWGYDLNEEMSLCICMECLAKNSVFND